MTEARKPGSDDTSDENVLNADGPTPEDGASEALEEGPADESDEGAAAEADGPLVLTEADGEPTTLAAGTGSDADTFDGETAADADGDESDRMPEAESETTPPAPPPETSRPTSGGGSGGFIPLLLGGVAAALIGFAVSRYLSQEQSSEMSALIEAQAAKIVELEGEIASVGAAAEAAATGAAVEDLRSGIGDLGTTLQSDLSALEARLSDLDQRILPLEEEVTTLAARPIPEAFDTEAFDAELKAFRDDLTAAIEAGKAEIATAREEADALRAEAEAGMDDVSLRDATIELKSALETGMPFADAVARASGAGVEVPEALTSVAEEGVATQASLVDTFPAAARSALSASVRDASPETTGDRLLAFLRVQTGARSLAPREGSDPDAILSRAEAALGSGELEVALSELAGLPEAGRAAMAEWTGKAETRRAALSAVERLIDNSGMN